MKGVLDSLAAFVGILTPDGVLIGANRAALSTVGLAPEELFGKTSSGSLPLAKLPQEKLSSSMRFRRLNQASPHATMPRHMWRMGDLSTTISCFNDAQR